MDNCLAPSSDGGGYGCDNMTVIIVALLHGNTKEQWYDMVAERVKNKDGPVAPKKFGIPPSAFKSNCSSFSRSRIQSIPKLE
jgi:hypothetical protein